MDTEHEWTDEEFEALGPVEPVGSPGKRTRRIVAATAGLVTLAVAATLFLFSRPANSFDILPDSTFLLVHVEDMSDLLRDLPRWNVWKNPKVMDKLVKTVSDYQVARLAALLRTEDETARQVLDDIEFSELAWTGFESDGNTKESTPQMVLAVTFSSMEALNKAIGSGLPDNVESRPAYEGVPVYLVRSPGGGRDPHVGVLADRKTVVVASSRAALTRVLDLAVGKSTNSVAASPAHREVVEQFNDGELRLFFLPSAAGDDAWRKMSPLLSPLLEKRAFETLDRLVRRVGFGLLLESIVGASSEGLRSGRATLRVKGGAAFPGRYGMHTLAPIDRKIFETVPRDANLIVAVSLAPLRDDPEAFRKSVQAIVNDLARKPLSVKTLLTEAKIPVTGLADGLGDTALLFSIASLIDRQFTYYNSAVVVKVRDRQKMEILARALVTSPLAVKTYGRAPKREKLRQSTAVYYRLQLDPENTGHNIYYGFVRECLIVTASRGMLTAAVDALEKADSILTNPNFIEAIDQVPERAGAVMLADVAKIAQEKDNNRLLRRRSWQTWATLAVVDTPGALEVHAVQLRTLIGALLAAAADRARAKPIAAGSGLQPRSVTDFLLLPWSQRSR